MTGLPVSGFKVLAVPEGAAPTSNYKDLRCQPPLIGPNVSNGLLAGVSTRGDLPPKMQTPAGKAGAAETINQNEPHLDTAADLR